MSDLNCSPDASTTSPAGLPGDAIASSFPTTLLTIFFEPGRTFDALRRRPRFLVAGLMIVTLTVTLNALLLQKINLEQYLSEQMERSPRTSGMSQEEKEQAIGMQAGPLGRTLIVISPAIATTVFTAAGAALYMLGAMMLGGGMSYRQALSVWVYSAFAPTVLGVLLGGVVLLIKSSDQIDLSQPGAGVLVSNLAVILDAKASPALGVFLASLDLFALYGIFLAAIGMSRVARLSSSAAWALVLLLWGAGVAVKVGMTLVFG